MPLHGRGARRTGNPQRRAGAAEGAGKSREDKEKRENKSRKSPLPPAALRLRRARGGREGGGRSPMTKK